MRKKLKKSQEPFYKEVNITSSKMQRKDPSIVQPKVLLEDSVWAPKNRPCDKRNSFKAKISLYKVLEDNKEYRVNYMK